VLYVDEDANSDELKWVMANRMGQNVSTFRVHSGWRGTPYDRKTPVIQAPPRPPPEEKTAPMCVLVPSFGP
jgi:hypothetical protein